jgi:hypothetical protein
MVGWHDVRVREQVYFNMRVGKDVESFRTNRIDTAAIIKTKISLKEVVNRTERQVVKIVILIISGNGGQRQGGTRRESNR